MTDRQYRSPEGSCRGLRSHYQLRERAFGVALASLSIALFGVGCQTDQASVVAQRNAVVQQQMDHDKALAQARADLEKQSADSLAASRQTPVSTTMEPLNTKTDPAKPSAEDVGLPVYPNSQMYKMAGAAGGAVQTGSGINVVLLETPDKPEAVMAFYEPKLTHTISSAGVKTVVRPQKVERTDNGQRVVKYTETLENQAVRIVKITREPDKTVIELMNIQPSTSQSGIPHPETGGAASTMAVTGSAAPTPDAAPLTSGGAADSLKPAPLLPGR